nr:immunoglobulin light chain junction region [Macaca mulatta]
CQHYHSLPFSF